VGSGEEKGKEKGTDKGWEWTGGKEGEEEDGTLQESGKARYFA